MKKNLILFVLLVSIADTVFSQDSEWISLFNGKDLKGWKQLNGEAKYEVKDGMIVGTTVLNTPNSFLCTEKNYSDFIFEVDLLVADDVGNKIWRVSAK